MKHLSAKIFVRTFIALIGITVSCQSTGTANSVEKQSLMYSSVFGSYNSILLAPRTPLLPSVCNDKTVGTIYVQAPSNDLYLCNFSGAPSNAYSWSTIGSSALWAMDVSGNFIYPKNDASAKKKIGIGTKTPLARLHLKGNAGILAEGKLGSDPKFSNLGATGLNSKYTNAGTRFFWYPAKAALRAGEITDSALIEKTNFTTDPEGIAYKDYWIDSNIGTHSIALGLNNMAAGNFSSILGGTRNKINTTSHHAFIGSGIYNQINGQYSSIIGGENNIIHPHWGFIAGGLSNNIENSLNSVIGGGEQNKITRQAGSSTFTGNIIFGGKSNTLGNTNFSIIGGGDTNKIYQTSTTENIFYSSILAGQENQILATTLSTSHSTLIGGNKNIISNAKFATIGGGQHNKIVSGPSRISEYSTIIGGINNHSVITPISSTTASSNTLSMGKYSYIGGGSGNDCYGDYSAIIGGEGSIIGHFQRTSPAGESFHIKGSFIGAAGVVSSTSSGAYIESDFSSIAGGTVNRIYNSGPYSFIGSGAQNNIHGSYSTILAGNTNVINQNYSFVSGTRIQTDAEYTFIWGINPGASPQTIGKTANLFLLFPFNDPAINILTPRGKVGIGETNPLAELHIKGNVRIDNGGLILMNPSNVTGVALNRNDATGNIGKDMAEIFPSDEEVEIGDVVVIDNSDSLKVKKSTIPYDKKVIGIVSAAPAILFEGSTLKVSPQPFEFTKGTNPPIALTGRVLCKVSSENGPIEPGDLLTTSSTPGHAMKADRDVKKSIGKIIGRALESFSQDSNEKNTGLITVLVTLH